MSSRLWLFTTAAALHAFMGAGAPALAQQVAAEEERARTTSDREGSVQGALASFERLIGGRWTLGSTYHVFSWGVGQRSVRGETYTVTDEGDELVAEVTWYYHPGEKVVKGYGVAVGMGIDFFEYETRFEGATFRHELTAYGPAVSEAPRRETWRFTGPDRYEWTLLEKTADGWTATMDAVFERR